jgi:hypothetical protein
LIFEGALSETFGFEMHFGFGFGFGFGCIQSFGFGQNLREWTNLSNRNRGILTIGLKTETVEIFNILFCTPDLQNRRFWKYCFVGKIFLKQRLYIKLYQI